MDILNLTNIITFLLCIFIGLLIYYLVNIGNNHVAVENQLLFSKKKIVDAVVTLLFIIVVLFIFMRFPVIPSMLVTVIISIVIAYIINPLVLFFDNKGLKRNVSILVVYLIILGMIALLLGLIIPKIVLEVRNFIMEFPTIANTVQMNIDEFGESVFRENQLVQDFFNDFSDQIKEVLNKVQESLFVWMKQIAENAPNYLSNVIRLVLIPVVAFYLLMDKEKIIAKTKSLIPDRHKSKSVFLFKDIDLALSQFVRGRLLMALFVGIATTILLLILQIDFAIVIGIITAIADVVPYIGPFLGFMPAFLLAFAQGPIKGIMVAIIFVLIQWIENNIIGPKILGESIGIHPLVVLLSLIIGGGMFGVAGMIFSVPVVATLKILVKYLKPSIINLIQTRNQASK